jgi:hypothetical protein
MRNGTTTRDRILSRVFNTRFSKNMSYLHKPQPGVNHPLVTQVPSSNQCPPERLRFVKQAPLGRIYAVVSVRTAHPKEPNAIP